MNDPDALVSLADLAEMAGVSRPAVSNWRRRNPDFPRPVAETGATSLFRLGDLMAWMAGHGKRLDVRSLDQLVWSALNPARGAVLPEEAAQAGMILLGYLALALRPDKTIPPALRAAIADNDQQALGKTPRAPGRAGGAARPGRALPSKDRHHLVGGQPVLPGQGARPCPGAWCERRRSRPSSPRLAVVLAVRASTPRRPASRT